MEQGHCTLIAVKRYRDPPRIGGRHNFLLRPYGPHWKKKIVGINQTLLFSLAFLQLGRAARYKRPDTVILANVGIGIPNP